MQGLPEVCNNSYLVVNDKEGVTRWSSLPEITGNNHFKSLVGPSPWDCLKLKDHLFIPDAKWPQVVEIFNLGVFNHLFG